MSLVCENEWDPDSAMVEAEVEVMTPLRSEQWL